MIASMPRPRPLHVQRERTRHGRVVWYVRRDRGGRVRIKADYGTPEFEAAYQAAISGDTAPTRGKVPAGSLAWLIERYRETATWLGLSEATRRQREGIFKQVIATAGDKPIARITTDKIIAGRERRAATPYQARHFLEAMRGLFRWAKEARHVTVDPAAGVGNPKHRKGRGYPPWSEADATAYEDRWPLGTKERVWFDVLCFTGARRGDAVLFGRQHVRDRLLVFRTEKSQGEVEVTIPILPVLARTLEAGPCGDLAFICGTKGMPLTKKAFGHAFSKAARAAGVRKSAHGVRKIAATRAADNGATVHQLMAIFGWTTTQMAELYTKEANRRRLAREAAHMLNKGGNDAAKAAKKSS